MAEPYSADDEQDEPDEPSVPYMTITNEDDNISIIGVNIQGENDPGGRAERNDLSTGAYAVGRVLVDTNTTDDYVQSMKLEGEQVTVNKAALHSLVDSLKHVKTVHNKELDNCGQLKLQCNRMAKEIQRLKQTHEGASRTQNSDRHCRSLDLKPNAPFVAPTDVSTGAQVASNSPKTPRTLKSVASQTDSLTGDASVSVPSNISDQKPINLVLPNTSVHVASALNDEQDITQAFSLLTVHGDTRVWKSRATEDSFSIIDSECSTERLPVNISLPHPTKQPSPPGDAQHTKIATLEYEELLAGADISAESMTTPLAKDLQWMKQQFAVAHVKVVAINNETKRHDALILSILANPKFSQPPPAAKLSMPVQQFGASSIHQPAPRNKARSRLTSALHRSAPPHSFPETESLSRSTPVTRSTYEMQDDLLRQFNTAESFAESFVPIDHGAGGDGPAVPLPTGSQDRLINALDIPISTNQLRYVGFGDAPPAVGAIEPRQHRPAVRVMSGEHICPVCLRNFGHFAMHDFQEHVYECADRDQGLDVNRAVPLSRKCPVCFAVFPDLAQTDFEKHCDDHFMQS